MEIDEIEDKFDELDDMDSDLNDKLKSVFQFLCEVILEHEEKGQLSPQTLKKLRNHYEVKQK